MKIIVSRKTYNKIMNAIDVAEIIIKGIIGATAFYAFAIVMIIFFG
jgi:hypothetical protein